MPNSKHVRVQAEDFDVGAELAQLRAGQSGEGRAEIGALVAFVGLVRDINDGSSVGEMVLEHYPAMTQKALEGIVAQAQDRWNIFDALVVHRVGHLKPTDQIVLVAVSGAHRGDAFQACEFIMDYLKTQAPFWKKEETPEGSRWVEARSSDDAAAARWNEE